MKNLKSIIISILFFIPVINVCQNSATEITEGMNLKRTLLKDQTDEYEVMLNKNDYIIIGIMQKGIDVEINAFEPGDILISTFDSPNGKNGPEMVSFNAKTAGVYTIKVVPLSDDPSIPDSMKIQKAEENQGDYEISSVEIMSGEEYQKMLEDIEVKNKNIIASIKEFAHPLNSVNPGSGFKDLEFLKPILKNVKYVGLGEATHGTKEFFQMKARMLEFLVKKLGYTVFAIEASYSGCMNINDYVLYGKGDAYSALATQGFWTWNTEEVIDMIEWMRNYNKSVPEEKKVKFLGIDIQANSIGGGIDIINDYLNKVDTLRALQTNSLFGTFKSMDMMQTGNLNIDSCMDKYLELLGFFVMSRGHYIQRSSVEEYESVLQYLTVVGQLFDAYFMTEKDVRKGEREWRDYYMASNFEYFVQKEKPGTKFVLWAHNGHISKRDNGFINGGTKPLGSYLKNAFGDEYYAFGFSFGKGGFQAMELLNNNSYNGLQEFITVEAKQNSLDWFFGQTGYSKFIFNFRDSKLPEDLTTFINSEKETRGYGAMANRDQLEMSYSWSKIGSEYDAMIFIDSTSRAIPTPTGR